MASELEQRDLRIAELEALVERQRDEIELLRAKVEGGSSGEELHELRLIVEAQEAALRDQRNIIDSQSGLIDELNTHVQQQVARAREAEEAECEENAAVAPAAVDRASSGTGAAGAVPAVSSGPGYPQQMTGAVSGAAGARGAPGPRRRPDAAQAPRQDPGPRRRQEAGQAPAPGGPAAGRGAVTARTHRESQHQLAAQQKLQQQVQSPRAELPRPRPNSALGERGGSGGGAPRARSWTAVRQGSSGGVQSARGPSPHSGAPGATVASAGMPNKGRPGIATSNGTLPPALPLLRQGA